MILKRGKAIFELIGRITERLGDKCSAEFRKTKNYGPHATAIACSSMYVQWYSTKVIYKYVSGQNYHTVGLIERFLRRVLICTQKHQRCRGPESQPWQSPFQELVSEV